MQSFLEHLHGDDDAILLMHLADELPAEDRAVVEQRLRDELAFRQRLEMLRATQADFAAAMRKMDAAHVVPGSLLASQRQVTRRIRQWEADRLAAEAARARQPHRDLRFPWWSYPLAAAAAVTFAVLAWWRTLPPSLQQGEPIAVVQPGTNPASPDSIDTIDPAAVTSAAQLAAIDSLDEMPRIALMERQGTVLELLRESPQ